MVKRKKSLSGGAIAGILISCIVFVIFLICAFCAGCFATSYKKQVYNSKGSDSAETDSEKPKSTESDPEKPNLEETNQKKETIQAGESVLDNSS